MTKLELHYAPGILALLKANPCQGRLAGWATQPKHGSICGCHGTQITWTVVAAHWLTGDEQEWAMHYAPRKQAT